MDRCQAIVISGRSTYLSVEQWFAVHTGSSWRDFPVWNVQNRKSVSGFSIPETDFRWKCISGIMLETNNEKRGNPGLESLRKRAKLNRKRMAVGTGVTPRMWQLYENEGRLPDKVEQLINIAVLAGVSVDEAIREIGYPIPTRDELLALIENAQTT